MLDMLMYGIFKVWTEFYEKIAQFQKYLYFFPETFQGPGQFFLVQVNTKFTTKKYIMSCIVSTFQKPKIRAIRHQPYVF
jgi:hypothetical protein